MLRLMKIMSIYLLAAIIAVESSGCATTQPVASEPTINTIQNNRNESESETSQAHENQAGTVPEEKKTEGDRATKILDTAGKVALVAGKGILILLYIAAISSVYCY